MLQSRIINIHPSLLPAFPGLDAQKQALNHGVKITGCTVHYVDESLDGGEIIFQRAVEVLPADTLETLSARILLEEHHAYTEAVKMTVAGIVLQFGFVVDKKAKAKVLVGQHFLR